jgi:hypothetical protein
MKYLKRYDESKIAKLANIQNAQNNNFIFVFKDGNIQLWVYRYENGEDVYIFVISDSFYIFNNEIEYDLDDNLEGWAEYLGENYEFNENISIQENIFNYFNYENEDYFSIYKTINALTKTLNIHEHEATQFWNEINSTNYPSIKLY